MSDPLRARLAALARFVPIFEAPGFTAGTWAGGQRGADGVITMPFVSYADEVREFEQVAYAEGWVLDFDWSEWQQSAEAHWLYYYRDALDAATPEQLARLLTLFIRQDRFIEGGLLGDFESGHILAIVRRAAALLAGMPE